MILHWVCCTFPLMVKWIAVTGLVLQFLAFWLAAPELLGESTLKRLQKGLEQFLSSMPVLLLGLIMMAYGGWFGVRGAYLGYQGSQSGDVTYEEMVDYYVVLGVCTLIYFVLVFSYKRIRRFLTARVAQPLIHQLIHQQNLRKQALAVGAILFTLGFLLQVAATIAS